MTDDRYYNIRRMQSVEIAIADVVFFRIAATRAVCSPPPCGEGLGVGVRRIVRIGIDFDNTIISYDSVFYATR